MADLPEYQKHVPIQPVAQPQGFGQGLAELGKAESFIGEIGAVVAQGAANQRARIAGVEAAQIPGRVFLPALGESEAEFQKAYKGQEYAIAMTNGNQALNNLALTAKKNLSPKSLLDYDATANLQIDNLVDKLTPENAAIVKNELRNQYLNQRAKLADGVFSEGQDIQRNQFKSGFDSLAKIINDAVANNDEQGAQNATNVFLDKIEKGEFNSLFNEHERSEIKRAALENLDMAIKRKDARAIIAKGKMEQVLKERTQLPQTADNLKTSEIYANEYRINQQMVNAYDDLVATNVKLKQANNTFSPVDMITAKAEMSPLRYAHLELETAKWMATKKDDEDLYAFFDANKDNGGALASGLSPGQLDKAFDQYVKNEALKSGNSDIFAQAQLAKNIDIAIPKFNKALVGMINSTNHRASVAASNIYSSLARDHANAVAEVDAKSAMKAGIISSQVLSGTPEDEAWKYASGKIDNLTPKQLDERKDLFKAELQAKELRNPLANRAMIASRMGFKTADIPPGLQSNYMENLEKNYVIGGDWEEANKVTTNQLKQVWRETTVNGFTEIMWMPPDTMIDSRIIKESVREDVARLFEAQYQDFNHNPDTLAPFYFKIIKSPEEEALSQAGIEYSAGKQIHIAKVDLDGVETKGILWIRSDSDTAYPQPGKPPSYSMQFLPDGETVPQLIYEPNNWSNARFYLPVEKVTKLQTEDERRKEAKKIELEAQAIVDLERKRVMEGLWNIGERPKRIPPRNEGFYGKR